MKSVKSAIFHDETEYDDFFTILSKFGFWERGHSLVDTLFLVVFLGGKITTFCFPPNKIVVS